MSLRHISLRENVRANSPPWLRRVSGGDCFHFQHPLTPSSAEEGSFFKRVAVLIGLYFLVCAPALASRELKDELGRRVTLPDNPQRVVCLAPSLTETVYALGLGTVVVGVTDFTDYPPEAQTKPSVGGLTDASLEKIVSLHPDLVLAMAKLNREETVDELEHVGIPVYRGGSPGLAGDHGIDPTRWRRAQPKQ